MNHRWDEMLQAEHRRRIEQSRYDREVRKRDVDVERRDRLAFARRRVNQSPWEIGASHWDQRDLYTTNSDVSDKGYARGPSFHPEEGSYAYHRDIVPPPQPALHLRPGDTPTYYEREAWPWLGYYDRLQPVDDERGLWGRVKHGALAAVSKLRGAPEPNVGPKGWWRADDAMREDVCEALAYTQRLDATDIEVRVQDAEVWLNGTVSDRHQKRLAEELAEEVRGVVDVHNRLAVRKDDDDLAFAAPVKAY